MRRSKVTWGSPPFRFGLRKDDTASMQLGRKASAKTETKWTSGTGARRIQLIHSMSACPLFAINRDIEDYGAISCPVGVTWLLSFQLCRNHYRLHNAIGGCSPP